MATAFDARLRQPFHLFDSGFASPEEVAANGERIIASRKLLHAPTSGPGFIQLIHGANEDVLPLGGQSVGEIRFQLDRLFNIAPDAIAMIGGHPVSEKHRLQHGDTLEFVVPLGRKGVGRVWTKDEFCILFKMSEADFDAMVARGLPVHRMEDGSIRITETQADDFLDAVAGKGNQGSTTSSIELLDGRSSLPKEISRSAKLINPFTADLAQDGSLPGAQGGATGLPDPGTIPAGRTVPDGGSTYLDAGDAAAYLGITVKSLYGIVERGHLHPGGIRPESPHEETDLG